MIRPISAAFFFTVYSFYKYVESNQSNTCSRKKLWQQKQTLFLQCFSLFLRPSVSSPQNKESMIAGELPRKDGRKGRVTSSNAILASFPIRLESLSFFQGVGSDVITFQM